jgi:TrmH family RNA methyltransferase
VFPLSKLGELPPRTRLRKIARILQGIEQELAGGGDPDRVYLARLLSLLEAREAAVSGAARSLAGLLSVAEPPVVLRGVNGLRHALLGLLGAEPSEWDLVDAGTGELDRSGMRHFPFTVYLEDIRSPFNVGSLFRTAEAFGVERIQLSPRTPLPTHPRAERTARGAAQAVPWEVAELEGLRGSGAVFALELGGTPLEAFPFPSPGTVLVGSEELGLSPEALAIADAGRGRVSIPLAGAKRSLNVSVAFGILMQAWYARTAGDA